MDDVISVTGPVERINGSLTLRIPLTAGGDKLVPLTMKIATIDGDCLNVVIKPWLADLFGVSEDAAHESCRRSVVGVVWRPGITGSDVRADGPEGNHRSVGDPDPHAHIRRPREGERR